MSWRKFKKPTGGFKGFKGSRPPDEPDTPPLRPSKPLKSTEGDFNKEIWQGKITAAVETANRQDGGSLSWCRENQPVLHKACVRAAHQIDEAFSKQDADELDKALQRFEALHEQARHLMAAPVRTADQLSPEERVRWCLACELAHPGSRCPTNKKNEGCGLWSAINHRRPLPPV